MWSKGTLSSKVGIWLGILIAMALVGTARATAQTGNNIRMTVQMPTRDDPMAITWRNIGPETCLLALGGIAGTRPLYTVDITLMRKEQGRSKAVRVIIDDDGGEYIGRPDPFVVVLPARASYTIVIPPENLRLASEHVSVKQIDGPIRITVVYRGKAGVDYAPGGRVIPFSLTRNGPTKIPFFIGSISADVELP